MRFKSNAHFQFLFHVGYKFSVRNRKISYPTGKKLVSERKTEVQNMFWVMLLHRVDKPKICGFGITSNDNINSCSL